MRVTAGKARHRSKKRLFKEARGNFGGRRKLLRTVKETVLRRAFGFVHRKLKKREYRALWIIRITAACRARDFSYSNLIHGLTLEGIDLNRKTLSELAIHEPAVFDEIVEIAKKAVASPTAA